MRSIRVCVLMAVFLVPAALPMSGQQPANRPLDPSYLNDMPSVERVKAEIQGKDATDTLARQVSVLSYLTEYIKRIKYNRTVRGPYTPDEGRMMGVYDLASYQITQEYGKSHTPAEADSFQRLHWKYDMDTDFHKDWEKRLIGPQTATAYKKMETDLAATQKAHYDQEMRDYQRDSAAQKAADKQIFGNQGLSNDPTAVAARRCLELGGSSLECVGKGFMSGLSDMMGMGEITSQLGLKERAGLVMVGSYNSRNVSLMFGGDAVTVTGCGKLIPDSIAYSIAKKGDHLLINVANAPRPFVLDWAPSGAIAGPGLVDVAGKIVTGYRRYWVQQRYTADNTIVPGSGHEETEPIYGDKTERCTIGAFKPVIITDSGAPASGLIGEMLGAVVDKFASKSVGPRLTGKFGSPGGLLADFSDDYVVLDCGQAHVKQPYTVESTANQILVHVQNSGGPFTFAVGPDNTLRGSGTTTIAGRLVTGMRGDDVTYAPHAERCEVGSLAPASGTRSNAIAGLQPTAAPVAGARPQSAAAQSSAPTPVSATRTAAPAPAPAGNSALAVNAKLGTGANPLAGQWFGLLNESIETIFRKAGVQAANGSSAVQAWMNLCKNKSPQCQQAMQSTGPYRVGKAQFDPAGKASLTGLASGTYYVLASTRFNGRLLLWNERVDVKPGSNAVVLEPANAVPVN